MIDSQKPGIIPTGFDSIIRWCSSQNRAYWFTAQKCKQPCSNSLTRLIAEPKYYKATNEGNCLKKNQQRSKRYDSQNKRW
jgi:hypothetical protein